MKTTRKNAGSFAMAKLRTISLRLIVIVIIAVIGFTMAACSNGSTDSGSLDGEWAFKGGFYWDRITFSGNTWLNDISHTDGSIWENSCKGTYTIRGNDIDLKITYSWDDFDSAWYPYSGHFFATKTSPTTFEWNGYIYTKQ
jgi:hypothetical protein